MSLKGQHVAITRPKEESEKFSALLKQYEAVPHLYELLTIEVCENKNLRRDVQQWDEKTLVIITSKRGMDGLLPYTNGEPRFKIATVGEKTKAYIESFGMSVHFMPSQYTAETLGKELTEQATNFSRIVYVRGNLASPKPFQHLQSYERDYVVYETLKNKAEARRLVQDVREGILHWLTFTSGSSVEQFMTVLTESEKNWLNDIRIAVIGPVTKKELHSYTDVDVVMPSVYTLQAMVEEMERK